MESSRVKPTIVIIHGGWLVPASYDKLSNALKSSGYEVHVPLLPSADETQPPNSGLSDDTRHIRSYVENLLNKGHKVIAIMHSYGGQVGTNALHGLDLKARFERGLSGGVSCLVYMTAFALCEGSSTMSKVEDMGQSEQVFAAFGGSSKDVVSRIRCPAPEAILIGDSKGATQEEISMYLSTLVPWNVRCTYDKITHAAWRDIPVLYMYATKDTSIQYTHQKSMVEFMRSQGSQVETVELEAGHSPNVTATRGVVKAINNVVVASM